MSSSVLLHSHLFKNAGSTLDWSLSRFFGDAFCDHRDDDSMRGNPSYLRAFIAQNPHLRALSSHWLPRIPRTNNGINCPQLVLLRDPIERIASVYAFEKRQQVEHPGTLQARSASFEDYVRWRLRPGTGPVIKNYQMRMLSGSYPGDDNAAQMKEAVRRLNEDVCFGLVHRYDQSMCLFEAELSEFFPGLDLSYVSQNVSDANDRRTIQERRTAVEDDLGDLLAAALEANIHDLRLFDMACEAFEKRWRALPDRESRLGEFRERCAALTLQ